MAETNALLKRHTGNRIEGSNPSVSARRLAIVVMRLGALGLALLALIAPLTSPAIAQATSVAALRQTPEMALAQDAAEYARQFGVTPAEALRRLRALSDSVAATDRIAEAHRDRLAGVTIEHRPDLRIVVYLTGTEAVPDQSIEAAGMTLPITFRTGAKATRDRLIWAMTWHQAAIRAALPMAPAMAPDPRTGELVIVVGSDTPPGGTDALRAKLSLLSGVPVRLRFLDQVDVNLAAEGGSRVEGTSAVDGKRYLCTTGFTVSDGVRFGIATAAHCLDELTYYDPQHSPSSLSFVGQWGWGYQDVQINAAEGPLAGVFYADTAKSIDRPVTGQRTRSGTRTGDFVCHRGERSGYSCALVELTDFAPAGDLCGGPCLPTWVTVSGPTCKGGDSGAPVFVGTVAMGIVKGATYRNGACVFYFYMSTDYLPRGWSLVLGPPSIPLGTVAGPPIGAREAP